MSEESPRLKALAKRNAKALELARVASLAVRAEPALLRRLRREVLNGTDTSAESDLWNSNLIESRHTGGLSLRDDVARTLWAELAQRPKLLEHAYSVVASQHAAIPTILQREEELLHLALARSTDAVLIDARIDAILGEIAFTIRNDEHRGRELASWAARALSRLPDEVAKRESAAAVRVAAMLRQPHLRWRRPPDLRISPSLRCALTRATDSEARVVLRRTERGVSLTIVPVDRSIASPLDSPRLIRHNQPEGYPLDLPNSTPLVLWVRVGNQSQRQITLHRPKINIECGDEPLEIISARGTTWWFGPIEKRDPLDACFEMMDQGGSRLGVAVLFEGGIVAYGQKPQPQTKVFLRPCLQPEASLSVATVEHISPSDHILSLRPMQVPRIAPHLFNKIQDHHPANLLVFQTKNIHCASPMDGEIIFTEQGEVLFTSESPFPSEGMPLGGLVLQHGYVVAVLPPFEQNGWETKRKYFTNPDSSQWACSLVPSTQVQTLFQTISKPSPVAGYMQWYMNVDPPSTAADPEDPFLAGEAHWIDFIKRIAVTKRKVVTVDVIAAALRTYSTFDQSSDASTPWGILCEHLGLASGESTDALCHFPIGYPLLLYFADANNDGQPEYVLGALNPVGSHNNWVVGAWQPEGAGLSSVPFGGQDAFPDNIILHFDHPFFARDPEGVTFRTQNTQLFDEHGEPTTQNSSDAPPVKWRNETQRWIQHGANDAELLDATIEEGDSRTGETITKVVNSSNKHSTALGVTSEKDSDREKKYYLVVQNNDGVEHGAESPSEFDAHDSAKNRALELSAQGKKIRLFSREFMGNDRGMYETPVEIWRTPGVTWHPRTPPYALPMDDEMRDPAKEDEPTKKFVLQWREDRQRVMRAIFDLSADAPGSYIEFSDIAEATGLSFQEVDMAVEYLHGKGLAKRITSSNVCLTPNGTELVEETITFPEAQTEPQPQAGVVINQTSRRTVGAVQTGNHNTTNVQQPINSEDLDKLRQQSFSPLGRSGTQTIERASQPVVKDTGRPQEVAMTDVDVLLVTMKPEEFEAVLEVFPEKIGKLRGHSGTSYNLRRAHTTSGGSYTVTVLKCVGQGTGEAQERVNEALRDFSPRLVLVVGIAGALPHSEFSLGDIVLSTHVHDFSLQARNPDGSTELALGGDSVERSLANAIAQLKENAEEMGDWTSGLPPLPPVPFDDESKYYGDEAWNESVRKSLRRNFDGRTRSPLFVDGAIGSSDRLMKDEDLLVMLKKSVRNLLAVEMEAAGAYRATRGLPFAAIRGISDVVGFRRDDGWPLFACKSAAHLARGFLRTEPIPVKTREDPLGVGPAPSGVDLHQAPPFPEGWLTLGGSRPPFSPRNALPVPPIIYQFKAQVPLPPTLTSGQLIDALQAASKGRLAEHASPVVRQLYPAAIMQQIIAGKPRDERPRPRTCFVTRARTDGEGGLVWRHPYQSASNDTGEEHLYASTGGLLAFQRTQWWDLEAPFADLELLTSDLATFIRLACLTAFNAVISSSLEPSAPPSQSIQVWSWLWSPLGLQGLSGTAGHLTEPSGLPGVLHRASIGRRIDVPINRALADLESLASYTHVLAHGIAQAFEVDRDVRLPFLDIQKHAVLAMTIREFGSS